METKKGVKTQEKVHHDYHDYANSDLAGLEGLDRSLNVGELPSRDESFPAKLHYMLNEIEKDGLGHIVSWQPHGRCFVIYNTNLFVSKILGSWFRMSKIASFQRQLNLYGFKRLTSGPDKGGYYHELFLRQRPHLALHIRRFKIKGQGMRRAASPETEPNFYAMSSLPPNPKAVIAASTAPDCRRFTEMTGTVGCELLIVPSTPVSSSNLSLQNLLPTALLATYQREPLSSTSPAWGNNQSTFTNMAAGLGQTSHQHNAPSRARNVTLEDLLALQNLLQQHQQGSPSYLGGLM